MKWRGAKCNLLLCAGGILAFLLAGIAVRLWFYPPVNARPNAAGATVRDWAGHDETAPAEVHEYGEGFNLAANRHAAGGMPTDDFSFALTGNGVTNLPVRKTVVRAFTAPGQFAVPLAGTCGQTNAGPSAGLYRSEEDVRLYPFNRFIYICNEGDTMVTDIRVDNAAAPLFRTVDDYLNHLEQLSPDTFTWICYLQELLKNRVCHVNFDRPPITRDPFLFSDKGAEVAVLPGRMRRWQG